MNICYCGATTGLRQYIDKHGDIELLCPICYAMAVHPQESPELRRRDLKLATVLGVVGVGVLLFNLFGCATFEPRVPQVSYIQIGNQVITEYVDAADGPKECGGWTDYAGCWSAGLKRIDYRSPVLSGTKRHERAHVLGMTHGEYSYGFHNTRCATVFAGGGEYHAGDTICVDQRGESIIPAPTYAEAK